MMITRRGLAWLAAVQLAAGMLGCATAVPGASTGDAGVADDAPPPPPLPTCANWVLTDRELVNNGELFTDLHRTFDAEGRIVHATENVRTGGHGIDRTYYEWAYRWSDTQVVVEQVNAPGERRVYTFEGGRLTRRDDTLPSSGTATTTIEYDASGRVTAVRGGRASCTYTYEPGDGARAHEERCDDGLVRVHTWDGERLVRTESPRTNGETGVDTWQWGADGRLEREYHDDAYGPGRGYSYDYVYDAAGLLTRVDSESDMRPGRMPAYAFEYDARGRVVGTIWSFDMNGLPSSVTRWQLDAYGRPVSQRGPGADTMGVYEYAVTSSSVVTTARFGTDRQTWRFQCMPTPPRLEPELPTPGASVAVPRPHAAMYPVDELPE